MNTRRRFLGQVALGGAGLAQAGLATAPAAVPAAGMAREDRAYWVAMVASVAEPALANLAANQLKARMPVECPTGNIASRRGVTHLEELGRTLAGIASWLGVAGVAAEEDALRVRFADFARQGLANATDPDAADFLSFTTGGQNLVDAAFPALALARGRAELWDRLDAPVRARLVAALQSTRKFPPGQSNWLLFSAMIEAFLASVGAEWKAEPIETAVKAHEEWFKGDGAYGDGRQFHWDYYNSYVIQPMLLEVLDQVTPVDARWAGLREKIAKRAVRYAGVQMRLVAPDGSFPPLGRSITYRCGAFHHLATMALRHALPEGVSPAQARGALAAVIRRTLGAPETFDAGGWLRVGLAGHQRL